MTKDSASLVASRNAVLARAHYRSTLFRGAWPLWVKSRARTLVAYRFELACSAIFASIVLVRVAPLDWPLGIGGLYALMAQAIQHSHFALPTRIPFYGPGGIPFAYPPAALYALAALLDIPGVSLFTWLRYIPVIMCALSLWPVYGLYREMLPSQSMARIATVLFAACPAWLAYNLWADGSVRAFGFFWAMLALSFCWRALENPSVRLFLVSSICSALAFASHLQVALFLVISVLIFALTGHTAHVRRFASAALILAGAAVITLPWWGTVLLRNGPGPFLHSTSSHHGIAGYLAPTLSDPLLSLVVVAAEYIHVDAASLPVYAIALLGFARCLRNRAWTLAAWTLALCIAMPEGQRFMAVAVAGAAAIPLEELSLTVWRSQVLRSPRARTVVIAAVLLLAGVYSSWRLLSWEFSVTPALTSPRVAAAHWLRTHSARNARFLLLTDRGEQAEWFPFLAHRTPIVGDWGAEWTGTYPREEALLGSVQTCAEIQSFACVRVLVRRHHLHARYVVVTNQRRLARLRRTIENEAGWREVYANHDTVIWRTGNSRRHHSAASLQGSVRPS